MNDLNVITGSFEQLVGEDVPVALGLTDAENNPLAGADIRLYAVPSGRDAIGPVPTEFREVPGNPLRLYVTRIDLVDPEITALVAVTADGERAGAANLRTHHDAFRRCGTAPSYSSDSCCRSRVMS